MPTTVSAPIEFTLDEGAFLKKVPFALHPTNLKGAYLIAAPPDDFDPKSASQQDLLKYGLLWRKPTATDDPSLRAAWDKFFSRKWLAKDRIVPELQPQIGRTHNLKHLPTKVSDTSYTGTVWSGAGTKTGKWTSIIGYWRIPTVSKPSEAQGTEGGWNSSSWLGLDGFFYSNDVLQAGIQQHVSSSGVATYVAWYEWFAPVQAGSPSYVWQTNIANFSVSPGQQVYCSVQYVGTTAGTIYFANEATGQHFSITLAPPPGASFNGGSCEWIMEAPDGGEPTSSLPKFTPVTFTSALACGPNNALANPQTGDTMNITTSGGKLLTATSVGADTTTITFVG